MADVMKKCILITGATGFLGSHLVKRLLREGQEVVILKRSFSDTCRIAKEMDRLKAYDIDKIDDITCIFEEQHIDVVIHTATCYGRQKEENKYILESNVSFPLALLEKAVLCNAEIFLNTDTVLPRNLNSYALSKKQFSEWGMQYAHRGKIRFIDAALEHIYGEDDSKSKFVTFLFESMWDNVPELNLTAGCQKRDFIYVEDVVEAYWRILVHQRMEEMYQHYEIGTGKAVRIKDFVIQVKKLLRSNTRLNFGAIPYRDGEIMESRADISKLLSLGWTPSIDIEKGLMKMARYKKKNIQNSGGGGKIPLY